MTGELLRVLRLAYHIGRNELPLLAGPVAEPPISPRTPPACVSPGFTNPRWLATLRSPGA